MRERLLLAWGRLHIGEVIRRRAVIRAVSSFVRPGVRILDAGCGRGDLAITFADRFPTITVDAVDIDPERVALVTRRIADARHSNCTIAQCDLAALDADGRYGIVYSVDVFEHLLDPLAVLKRIARALTPRGILVLHVPATPQQRWFRTFAHYDQHDHVREGFSVDTMTGLLGSAELTVVQTQHTFGPPGALAWECFHLAQRVGKWMALLTYPIVRLLAMIDGWMKWKRGNGLLVIAQRIS